MGRNSIYAKFLSVLILATAVLAACTATNNPTPQAPLAEVVTVERPSATATPPPSSTPAAIMSLLETAVPTSTPSPTATQSSTPTPTVMATPFLAISAPILSSQGQLAFIKNQTLFVETAVGSQDFNKFGANIAGVLWSPQGNQLLFSTCNVPGQIDCEKPRWILYDLEKGDFSNLADIIPDLPEGDFGYPTWMGNGTKLLFQIAFEGNISVVDLAEKTYSTPIQLFFILNDWELPNENLLIQDHFGTWSNALSVYSLNGSMMWSFPNPRTELGLGDEGSNAGILGFSEPGELLVILEPDEELNEFVAFYHFDPKTLEIESLFSIQAPPFVFISPNGQFVALFAHKGNAQGAFTESDLIIVDQNGRSYGQRPNSIIMDWRPSGGPVVKESVAEGQTQLVYWPLDGAAARVFVSPKSFVFDEGRWSGDGRFFIYSAVDEAENKSRLYLWHPESDAPTLLHTAAGTDGFRNFAWLPDSTAVYFNLGQMELWKFEVATESLTLIASSEEN